MDVPLSFLLQEPGRKHKEGHLLMGVWESQGRSVLTQFRVLGFSVIDSLPRVLW